MLCPPVSSELSDAQQFLARLTSQRIRESEAASARERRSEPRIELAVGILVVPLRNGMPELADAFAALTKDVSPTGLSVVANQSISTLKFLACFSGQSERKILRTEIRSQESLGSGWFRISTEVTGAVAADEYPELGQLTDAMASSWS